MLFSEEQRELMRYVATEAAAIVSKECKENILEVKKEIIENINANTDTKIQTRKYQCNEEMEETHDEIKRIKRFRNTFNILTVGTAITVCGKVIYDYFHKIKG